jgi:hypothetical protein
VFGKGEKMIREGKINFLKNKNKNWECARNHVEKNKW